MDVAARGALARLRPRDKLHNHVTFSKKRPPRTFSTDGEFLEKPEKPAYTPGHLLP